MPLITFTSDYGVVDHYVAAVKAVIYRSAPRIDVIDISHQIQPFDLAHGAFVLKSVYREFPEKSVHLVSVNADAQAARLVAARLHDHYFVGADNGLISLLSEARPDYMVQLDVPEPTTFATKDVLAPAAIALARGLDINKLGGGLTELDRKIPRSLRATRKQINGHVIRVNHYGNLITNIDWATFSELSADKSYQIMFGRERVKQIHQTYRDVDLGECVLMFNSLGLLEVSINQGNARDLLGLGYDSPVIVRFEPTE